MMRQSTAQRCTIGYTDARVRAKKSAGPLRAMALSGCATRGISLRVMFNFRVMSHDSTPRRFSLATGNDFNMGFAGQEGRNRAPGCWDFLGGEGR